MHLCAICLSPLGGMLSNLIGRRQCFILFTSIGTIGWITVALSPNSETLFVGRFLTVIGTGGLSPSVGKFSLKGLIVPGLAIYNLNLYYLSSWMIIVLDSSKAGGGGRRRGESFP